MRSKRKLEFEFFSAHGSDRLYRCQLVPYQLEANENEYTATWQEQEA